MVCINIGKEDKDCLRLLKLHEKCFKDLTGKKFGRLTVMNVDHKKGKLYYWKCLCDCGNYTVVAGSSLPSGHTKSCGCLHKMSQLVDLVETKTNYTIKRNSYRLRNKEYIL